MRKSPNSKLVWHQVLDVLGTKVINAVTPTTVVCPLCRSCSLSIFDDSKFGGQWHYCSSCKSSGDMIKLSAALWKCSLQDTIIKLLAVNAFNGQAIANVDVREYLAVAARQQGLHDLLVSAANRVKSGSTSVYRIGRLLFGSGDISRQAWPERMGKFVGCVTVSEFSKVIPKAIKVKGKGELADEVLIAPYCDLPGRITGFLCGRSQGRPYSSFENIVCLAGFPGNTELGFLMNGSMDGYKELGNNVIVCPDPMHAFTFQTRHFRDNSVPLPIVGLSPELEGSLLPLQHSPQKIWQVRGDKRFVFFAKEPTPRLFEMAIRADAHIYLTPADPPRLPPYGYMAKIVASAIHWSEALEKLLVKLTDTKKIEYVQRLVTTPELLHLFQACSTKMTRQMVGFLRGNTPRLRSVRFGGETIQETDNGWFTESGDIIANAILRIDTIIRDVNGGEPERLSGRILHEKQEIPFCESSAIVNVSPAKWMGRKIMDAGKFPQIQSKWGDNLIELACRFHQPEIVNETARFGWNFEQGEFVLPRCTFKPGVGMQPKAAVFVPEHAPAREMPLPTEAPANLGVLTLNTESNCLFWAVMACVLANIMAPAVGVPPAAIGLSGAGANRIGRMVARNCGCFHTHRLFERMLLERGPRLNAALRDHNWPVLLSYALGEEDSSELTPWLNGNGPRNAIITVSRGTANMAGVTGPWLAVFSDTVFDVDPAIDDLGKYVLPVWLHSLCAKGVHFPGPNESLVCRVVTSLAKELELWGCDPSTILESLDLIIDASKPVDRGDCFGMLLQRLCSSGMLDVVTAEIAQASRALVRMTYEGQECVFCSLSVLNRLLLLNNWPALYDSTVREALRSADALVSEYQYNDEEGWLISGAWFDEQFTHWRKRRNNADYRRR